MLNLLFGFLLILFTKEFIVINQEIIIYCVFLSILFLCIKSFSSLTSVFENIRSTEKSTLNLNSKNQKIANDLTILQLSLNSNLSSIFSSSLPHPDFYKND